MKIKTFQFNASTILGIIALISTLAMLFTDMYYSTLEVYTFELEATHVKWGIVVSVSLILLPQDVIINVLKRITNK